MSSKFEHLFSFKYFLREEGGEILCGGKVVDGDGFYVLPAIVNAENHYKNVQEETFAPILYVIQYDALDEALLSLIHI